MRIKLGPILPEGRTRDRGSPARSRRFVDAATMRLSLIRHPQPAIAPGTCYGQLDIPAEAPALAALVRGCLALPPPRAVFTSPLARCREVAAALAMRGWPAPQPEARIAELDFGDWEGRRWDEIGRKAIAAWVADLVTVAPPNGETVQALAARALAFVEQLLADPALGADTRVVLFTHAGVIQTLPRMLRGEALAGFAATRVDYATLTELRIGAPGGGGTGPRTIEVLALNQPLAPAS